MIDNTGAERPRLIELTAIPTDELVLMALQRGRLKLFQRIESGRLVDADIAFSNGAATGLSPTVNLDLKYDEARLEILKKKALALLPKPNLGEVEEWAQRVEITGLEFEGDVTRREIKVKLEVKFQLLNGLDPTATLGIVVNLRDFSMRMTGGDRIAVKGTGEGSPIIYRILSSFYTPANAS